MEQGLHSLQGSFRDLHSTNPIHSRLSKPPWCVPFKLAQGCFNFPKSSWGSGSELAVTPLYRGLFVVMVSSSSFPSRIPYQDGQALSSIHHRMVKLAVHRYQRLLLAVVSCSRSLYFSALHSADVPVGFLTTGNLAAQTFGNLLIYFRAQDCEVVFIMPLFCNRTCPATCRKFMEEQP